MMDIGLSVDNCIARYQLLFFGLTRPSSTLFFARTIVFPMRSTAFIPLIAFWADNGSQPYVIVYDYFSLLPTTMTAPPSERSLQKRR